MPNSAEIARVRELIAQYTAMGWTKQAQALQQYLDQYLSGDFKGIQGTIAGNDFLQQTPEQEKWLDNMISSQNTEEARNWEETQSQTDLLKAADQLQQLGLSASGVLSTGGSSVNAVGAASNVKSNLALERYQMKMNIAKQLLGMTSSMASAGIYGHALGAAKKASSILTSAASHSALGVMTSQKYQPRQFWNSMISELESLNPKDDPNINPGFGF